MNSRADQTWTQSADRSTYGSSEWSGSNRDLGSAVADSMTWMTDQMIRWPFWMTTASVQLMLDGMQRMTGGSGGSGRGSGSMTDLGSSGTSRASGSSSAGSGPGASWVSNLFGGSHSQDLSSNDLKYVVWSIVFNKPNFECVLEHQQDEIINYDTDGSSFAALKIAKFLEKARHAKVEKPSIWTDRNYPPEAARRQGPEATNRAGEQKERDGGWRIPGEDQKYIHFLYRVERRLPKQEVEVTRVVTTVREERSSNSAVA